MTKSSLKNLYIAQAKKVAKEVNGIVNRSPEELFIVRDGNVIVKFNFKLNTDYYWMCNMYNGLTNKQIIDKMYFDLLCTTLYSTKDIREIDKYMTDDYAKNIQLLKDAYFGKAFERKAEMYFV